ncbi:hypothetical protein GWE18_38835 [Bradyrhizobium sp. CSA112]|uniref:hypothetical protein n=1 Tax=Bradyrhizobium sp. CSA112 TaxID=2699170 RepID=UPI0023AFDD64|nr:hypothetical protein [Bradyrhizobium sp. CSA112]MDE5458628.1 hypothetical protein [Bradyrhizobium sp. CSA112]
METLLGADPADGQERETGRIDRGEDQLRHPHLISTKKAEIIIAINSDRAAPIFEIADLRSAGDALQIVPEVARLLAEWSGVHT